MRKACQKKHGLPVNMWFDYSQMPFVSFICSLTNDHLWPVMNKELNILIMLLIKYYVFIIFCDISIGLSIRETGST